MAAKPAGIDMERNHATVTRCILCWKVRKIPRRKVRRNPGEICRGFSLSFGRDFRVSLQQQQTQTDNKR